MEPPSGPDSSNAAGPGGFAGASTTTVTVNAGVATFSNLVLNTAGSYTLGESGTNGLTGPASASFTVVPAGADHLGFGVQPSTTVAGVAVSPAVTVQVFDQFGNFASNDNSGQVTLTLSGPAELLGDSPFDFGQYGGLGAVWIRSLAGQPGAITLTASHPLLGQAEVQVRSLPVKLPSELA